MTITVIVGPPCAGKTTLARKQHKAGDVLVDFDQIAEALGSPDGWDHPPAVERAAQAARRAAIRYLLRQRSNVTAQIIHANPPADAIAEYVDAGADFIMVDPGLDECLARAERDKRPPHFDQIIRAWYNNPPQLPAGADTADQKGNPRMFTKNAVADFKAGPDDGLDEGEFTAYASVFDTVDSYGDVVTRGAFADSLKDWESSGTPIPLYYGHNLADPDFNIGHITSAVEDDHGLKVTAKLDLEAPKAAQVYRLLKGKRVTAMSFGFDILDAAPATIEHDGEPRKVLELRRLKIHEVSVVPIGANPDTEILAVKAIPTIAARAAAAREAGAQIPAKTIATLEAAREAIDQILTPTVETTDASSESPQGPDAHPAPASETPPADADLDALTRLMETETPA